MVGRGGAGNQARSPSSGEQVQTEAEERAARSRSRTREDLHTGRGGPSSAASRCFAELTAWAGAGNVRSPSRMREDPAAAAAEQAKEACVAITKSRGPDTCSAALKQQAQTELKSFHAAGRGACALVTKWSYSFRSRCRPSRYLVTD